MILIQLNDYCRKHIIRITARESNNFDLQAEIDGY